MKLKNLLGMSDDQAEQLKDICFGYVLGVLGVLIPLGFQILLRVL